MNKGTEPVATDNAHSRLKRVWELVSCMFVSQVILTSCILAGLWSVTGECSLTAAADLEIRDWVYLALRLSLCVGVGAFLTTYALSSVVYGLICAVPGILPLLWRGELTFLPLVIAPAIAGVIVGNYLNRYSRWRSDQSIARTRFEANHVRFAVLALCAIFVLFFVEDFGPLPVWLACLLWCLEMALFSSGAVLFVNRRTLQYASRINKCRA